MRLTPLIKKRTLLQTVILFSAFTIIFFSCSKSDDSPGQTEPAQLVLKASANTVLENEEVTFEITSEGQTIAGSTLYINNIEVSGLTHNFPDAGTYEAQAKKQGYRESNTVSIQVNAPLKIKITATRVISAPRNPALGSEYKMGVDQNLQDIFTFDREYGKFMSYNIASNSWQPLTYSGQLAFAGYGGKMLGNTRSGQIYYLGGEINIYNTFYYPETPKRNTWEPSEEIDDLFAAGEAGYALEGESIYSVGGRMRSKQSSSDIRKYNLVAKTWEKVGRVNTDFRDANAILANKKLYILGSPENSNDVVGYIYDTEELTVKSWSLPADFPKGIRPSVHQLAKYGNDQYLLYSSPFERKTISIYNLNTETWEPSVEIDGDFFTMGNINIFSRGNTLYAAGSKDGNFALYKLEVIIP